MQKKPIIAVITVIVLLITAFTIAMANTPAGENDPLISKSYIDNVVMPQIYAYIDGAIAKISNITPGTTKSQTESFEVVSVKAGEKIIADAGCEMILRQGKASIIATAKGGLANVTDGADLANGVSMPSNCLLIVPVSDGRGLSAETDLLVMIKGTYELVK